MLLDCLSCASRSRTRRRYCLIHTKVRDFRKSARQSTLTFCAAVELPILQRRVCMVLVPYHTSHTYYHHRDGKVKQATTNTPKLCCGFAPQRVVGRRLVHLRPWRCHFRLSWETRQRKLPRLHMSRESAEATQMSTGGE